jgi:hypothetical protein
MQRRFALARRPLQVRLGRLAPALVLVRVLVPAVSVQRPVLLELVQPQDLQLLAPPPP